MSFDPILCDCEHTQSLLIENVLCRYAELRRLSQARRRANRQSVQERRRARARRQSRHGTT